MLPGWTIATPWGRGVGKSHFLRQSLYLSVAAWDGRERVGALKRLSGVRWVLMLPTFKQAKDVHAKDLEADLSPSGEWGWLGAKIDRTSWLIKFPGGSWIQLFGAENAYTSRGMRTDGMVVDECDDVDPPIFDSVISPWFSEPWSLKTRMVCGTPRRGRYGLLYRTFRRATAINPAERAADHFAIHATGYDTPETVDRAYLDKMKAETPPAIFRREYLCDFDSAEGLVYSVFDESFHVREPHRDAVWSEVLIGVDHGYEDPGVMLVAGVAGGGRDASIHLLHEVYQQHRTEGWWLEQAKALHQTYPAARWYADPSRPDRIEAMRRLGLRIEGAENAIEAGVSAVVDRMAKRGEPESAYARLYISPQCSNTIRELGLYRRKRDPREPERVLDDIEDKNNHAMDALRYLTFSRFGAPSTEVRSLDGNSDFGWG